jgi:hypothetical protein
MFGTTAGMLAAAAAIPAMVAGAGFFFVAWAVAAWLICAILVAVAAHGRGRSGPAWLLLALLLTPLPAGLMLMVFVDRSDRRRRRDAAQGREGLRLCPSCSEVVRSQARRCRFCLADLTRRDEPAAVRLSDERMEPRLR